MPLFEAWNSETRQLAAIVEAPDMERAIRIGREAMALYDNAKATPDNLFVCLALPENTPADAAKVAERFGVWMA